MTTIARLSGVDFVYKAASETKGNDFYTFDAPVLTSVLNANQPRSGRTGGRAGGWAEGRKGGRIDRLIDGRMDRWAGGLPYTCLCACPLISTRMSMHESSHFHTAADVHTFEA